MRKLASIAIAVVLVLGVLATPAAEKLIDTSAFVPNSRVSSIRDALYSTSKGLYSMRAFRAIRDDLPADNNQLLFLASSDIWFGRSANPRTFVPKHFKNFDMILLGQAGSQSLSKAITIGAVAPVLKQKKVALHLAPQWFNPRGQWASSFKSTFPNEFWREMLANPQISLETKTRISQRVHQLYPELCENYGDCPPGMTANFVKSPNWPLTQRLDELNQYRMTTMLLNRYSQPYDPGPGTNRVDAAFWERSLTEAETESAGRSRNRLFIDDDIYEKEVLPILDQRRGKHTQESYDNSPEYADLELFLTVARETGVEVLLLLTPESGRWDDITGFSKEARQRYYQRIRQIAAQQGVKLADLTPYEYEPYFFSDPTHFGRKGWIRVTKECYEFTQGS